MKRLIKSSFIVSLLMLNLSVFGQDDLKGLLGTYSSVDNEFEKSSVMTLQQDNKFIYVYAVGGCQAEITGQWKFKDKKIIFLNDPEFLNNEMAFYPDLSKVEWVVKKFGIKPIDLVDTGCLKEKALHRKIK